jgi:hypothetical protein
VKAIFKPLEGEVRQLISNGKITESYLQKIHNCLLFNGDESMKSSKMIRSLNPRERALWFLEHPGVRDFLLEAFFNDPKPESKEDLWENVFSHLTEPPPR